MMQIKFEIFKHGAPVEVQVLAHEAMKVGRLPSCHLSIDDGTVSRLHAIVEHAGPDDVRIVDLGSIHGTWVNGVRIHKATVRSGDEILFGTARVRLTFPYALIVEYIPPPKGA